jgi:TolA-binding protein
MDAVTYPQPKVIEFLNSKFVPVRVAYNAQPLATDFNVNWTPTLVTLDADGKEHHRTVGFLPAEELVPSLMLGMAKSHFDRENFEGALSALEGLLAEYPKSDAAAEAIFLQGVSRYKHAHDPKPLKGAYERLQREYPSSEWTKRAYPYRLIP